MILPWPPLTPPLLTALTEDEMPQWSLSPQSENLHMAISACDVDVFGCFVWGIDVKNIWKLWLMYIKQHPNRMKSIYLTIVYIKYSYSYTLIVIWKLWLMYIYVSFFVNPTKWQKKTIVSPGILGELRSYNWLVVWNMNGLWFSHHIGNVIIPTDYCNIFQRGRYTRYTTNQITIAMVTWVKLNQQKHTWKSTTLYLYTTRLVLSAGDCGWFIFCFGVWDCRMSW